MFKLYKGDFRITNIEYAKQSPLQLMDKLFSAKIAKDGGVVRRNKRTADKIIGSELLKKEVIDRGYHMFESGGQYIIICNQGELKVIC